MDELFPVVDESEKKALAKKRPELASVSFHTFMLQVSLSYRLSFGILMEDIKVGVGCYHICFDNNSSYFLKLYC